MTETVLSTAASAEPLLTLAPSHSHPCLYSTFKFGTGSPPPSLPASGTDYTNILWHAVTLCACLKTGIKLLPTFLPG